MNLSVERPGEGEDGGETWYFVVEADEHGHARLIVTGYEGGAAYDDPAAEQRWYADPDLQEQSGNIGAQAVPIPDDVLAEARAQMIENARLAIRAYIAPATLPTD